MNKALSQKDFDKVLVSDCARVFSLVTGIGTVVSLANGEVLSEYGYGHCSCEICSYLSEPKSSCMSSQIYGMKEAERFGGKYIFFCPMGLVCFVSPIVTRNISVAKITVGPFLMVDKRDYIDYDIIERQKISPDKISGITKLLDKVPDIDASKVNDYATLLFMCVSFINGVSFSNMMLDTQLSDTIQKNVSSYVQALKGFDDIPKYPFHIEKKLLESIGASDKESAQKYLNELFGHIFFLGGNDFDTAKSRIYELLVLILRKSIDAGADPDRNLELAKEYLNTVSSLHTTDDLCLWLSKITGSLMEDIFAFSDAKHSHIIHKTIQYVYTNYNKKITLEDVADTVYLSPTYFSRIFKKEMGTTFNSFLSNIRIQKSKKLLLDKSLKIVDIALYVGFDDQSYFTKVFKKVTGVSPLKYRESHI